MSPLPFFSRGFDPFLEGLSSSVSSLNDHWLWLFSLALVGLAVTLIRSWSWLLDWEAGRWWPVPASLLPAMIPITRDLQEDAPSWVKTGTVVVLLTAVAVLLAAINEAREGRDEARERARSTEALLCRIADGITTAAAAAEEAQEENE